MALTAAARELVRVIRHHNLNYDTFRTAAHSARKHLGIKQPARGRKLPKLLTEAQLKAYVRAVDETDNLTHQIMVRILIYTGVRVAELCAIKVTDVDLIAGKIFIESGKGDKDRYILFPDQFRLSLRAYVGSIQGRGQTYLFESNQRRAFSTRWIQKIIEEYGVRAQIEERVHPHLFRHQCLTWLTAQGMTDAAIQLISGHASKKSLERYQHMSLGQARDSYQDAVRKMGVD